jgi:DNA-binding NarL/FixJ family response regulator
VIRVVIVEDHPLFRQGLARAVHRPPEFACAASVGSLEELALDRDSADVAVLDLHLQPPGLSGAPAVRHLIERGFPVLVVSADSGGDAVLDALEAGASGYVTKQAEPDEVLAAITKVAEGGTYISASLAGLLLQATRDRSRRIELSDRETQILRLLAAGERDQDIARELFITVATVRTHLDRIRDKTGRHRRADLTRLALQLDARPDQPAGPLVSRRTQPPPR